MQLMAHALLENAYATASTAPAAAKLYPYETFLAWRLRDLSLVEILQVRRAVKAGARQWAEAARIRGPRAKPEGRSDRGSEVDAVVRTRRLALELTRRAWHDAASMERLLRASLPPQTLRAHDEPLAASLATAADLRPGGARVGLLGALAWKVDTARRSLIPPALRPREIERWVEALHGDLKLRVGLGDGSAGPVRVLVGSLSEVSCPTPNVNGSYAFTTGEAETMHRSAERRRQLAEVMVDTLLHGRCPREVLPRARDAIVRLAGHFERDLKEAFPGEGGAPDLTDGQPGVEARLRRVEARLSTAVQALPADLHELLRPLGEVATESAGSANGEASPGEGCWSRLDRHWTALEALVEAQDDLEAWAEVAAALEPERPRRVRE
ncbi:MAG: hypothetical protein IPL40_04705 [Proteobacteria bacterium]|nr:hypothetical protein [Pseudomonadota bacterium]